MPSDNCRQAMLEGAVTLTYQDIITIEPGKRGGRPIIRGMRIAVADVLGWLAAGMTHEQIVADYPELTEDDIRACSRLCGRSRAAPPHRREMKLLFDQNPSFKLCGHLTDLFPGTSQVRLVGLAESGDRAVWDYAKTNGFMLVSLDSDFAEMAALLGSPPKVIWLRCGNQPTS
jgi:uncharacterized protein (DUF433 family)/predicted nuclease of predicted toxin-antitoxin system